MTRSVQHSSARLLARAAALAMATCALGAGAAQATDYCVAPATGCTGPNTFTADGAGVVAALAAATGPSDRVLLGAATYTAPTTAGFTYNHPGLAPEIVGAGAGQTILTGPTDTGTVLYLNTASGGLVHDVGLAIPLRSANPSFLSALNIVHGTARRVAITSDPALNGANALQLGDGGTFEDGSVTLPMSGPVAGLSTLGTGGTLRTTTMVAAKPLNITTDDITVERVHATAGSGSALSLRGVNAHLRDSVLVQPGTAAAVYLSTGNGTDPTLRLDHDTIVGTSGAVDGLYAGAADAGHTSAIDVHDSIITGFAHARHRYVAGAGTGATITTSHSAYDPSGDLTSGTVAGSTGEITPFPGTGDVDVAPGFVDAAGGDYRLAEGSPLVDAGDPAAPLAGEPAVDLAGAPRVLDGTHDCAARTDIGAYELQPAPTARATRSDAPTAGAPMAFDAATSCAADGGPLSAAWSFDDGAAATGTSVQHAFATAGTHTATLTVTDGDARTATATLSFDVAAAPDTPATAGGGGGTGTGAGGGAASGDGAGAGGGGTGGATGTPADHVAPLLSGLRATPAAFAVRTPARAGRRATGGTTLRFTLSEAATVTLALRREVAGHRAQGRCVAGAPAAGSGGRRCTLLRGAGTVTLAGRAGANAVAFSGRVGAKALPAGRYRLTATARDAAGNRTAKPATLRLRIKA
jgi:hypothetical protein